jgi:saccharopine dehydrogenase-like NADP-dependent oxidoreductase
MKALVLGCGEMARPAIDDLVRHGVFERLTIASRHPEQVEPFLATLPPHRVKIETVRLDVHDHPGLVRLMRGHDAVCNLAGPNYQNAVAVAKAAIGAGVSLVDVSDDWAATLELLDLHPEAKRAGITIIVGLGASPGITNILARYGADKLDRVEEVRTSWIMRGSDMGGLALSKHLLYSNSHRAFVFEDGEMREVRPFVDGKEIIDYPGLGPVEVMHIGHPEPFTLSRYIEGIRYADDKATFLPVEVNTLLLELGRVARSGYPVMIEGRPVDPMTFAASYVHQTCARLTDVPQTGALRTEVRGELAGKAVRLVYAAAGRITIGTGIPASIGTMLLAIRKVNKPGVWPPEACIEPEWFLAAVDMRHLGDIEEQAFDWDRDAPLAVATLQ